MSRNAGLFRLRDQGTGERGVAWEEQVGGVVGDDAGATLGDEQKSHLGHIRTAGEHLLSLINDALELSSLESGNLKLDLQTVDLGAMVTQALPLVESLAAQRQVRLHDRGHDGARAQFGSTDE